MSRPVLAVDFGTSNSYFCKCPHDDLIPSPVDFISGSTGMDTAILYREGRSPLVGAQALSTWGEASEEERAHYSLLTRFKPEIDVDERAFKGAVDFLSQVREDARRMNIVFNPMERDVFFGVPCQASESYVLAVKKAAEQAGYGEVNTVEEPLGALLFHLSQGDMSPSEAMGSVLVLDFGGGTFDAALLEKLDVKDSWGDWAMGGRLFDDLFYQILVQANPELVNLSEDPGREYFVHWYWSRVLKEGFSDTMSRDREEIWTRTAGTYGAIRHLRWEEFISMASDYRPTDQMLRSIGVNCPGMNGPENLLHRVSQLISRGRGAKTVILAGGSCLWPFIPDMVRDLLPDARLIRSDQPYGVVARGLSLLPALRSRNDRSIAALRGSLPDFMGKIRSEVVDRLLSKAAQEGSLELSSLMIEKVVVPVLMDYRANGGSLSRLRGSMESGIDSVKEEMDGLLRSHMDRAARTIPKATVEMMARWFKDKGIKSLPRDLNLALGEGEADLLKAVDLGRLSPIKGLVDSLDGVIGIVVGLVTASLCGGGGIALIATGIPGLLAGAAIGLGGYVFGRKSIREKLEKVPVNSVLSRFLMSEGPMRKTVEKARVSIAQGVDEAIRREWAAVEPELMSSIREVVEEEIKGLSLINQIEGGSYGKG
ncbi:Hsp70 family protein [Dethiosulfovibrio salsuginis]|uniref:Hsp70 protein n=1 Tax=Dethiosulfovibrio salsuginis TaxID=561720 RepID=A0A1X7IRC7_9BACT|nr:Hsp70 family protein [Dethiosulfovibrio salsuginis]SMG17392.1 Hsp70 protein [Dethiosulfovibrio salsuginis]